MAERIIDREILTSGNIEQVRPYGLESQAKSMQALGNTLSNVSDTLKNEALDLAVLDFNATAADELNKIYYSNPAEPEQLRKNYDEYWKGYSKNLPYNLRSNMQKMYVDLSERYVQKALTTKAKNVSAEKEMYIDKSENVLYRTGVELSVGITSKDPAEQQMGAINLLDTINAHNNLLYTKGADGSYLFTPDQIQKRQQDFLSNTLSTLLQNDVLNSENPLDIIERIETDSMVLPPIAGVSTENINISAMINPDTKAKISKDLRNAYMERIRTKETLLNIEEKQNNRLINKVLIDVDNSVSAGGPSLTPKQGKVLMAMAPNTNVAKEIASRINNPQTVYSDMSAVNEVRDNIAKGIPQNNYLMSNRHKFSNEDYQILMKENNLQFSTPSNPYDVGLKGLLDMSKMALENPGAEFDTGIKMGIINAKTTYEKLYRDFSLNNPNKALTFEEAEVLKNKALELNLDLNQRQILGLSLANAKPEEKAAILQQQARTFWDSYYAKKYPKADNQKKMELLNNDPVFQQQINSIKKQLGQ